MGAATEMTNGKPDRYRIVDSPIGALLLVGRHDVLTGLYVADHARCRTVEKSWSADEEAFDEAVHQLEEYFAGDRATFDVGIELDGTDFQRAVWRELLTVPYGATTSYGAIAAAIGRPKAVRAVGLANGANPVSIIVPCHRVIGASGALTGYGWGIERKRWLLDHESGVAHTTAG